MSAILNEVNYFWKLGYNEYEQNRFKKKYKNNISIIIDVKNEEIIYDNKINSTKNIFSFSQKEFIILETIDRILSIGYSVDKINRYIENDFADISLIEKDNTELKIKCCEYENEFPKLKKELNKKTSNLCLYTSRLKAGLIEYDSVLFINRNIHSNFIQNIHKYKVETKIISNNFSVTDDGTLIEYHGNSKKIIIPEGVVKLKNALFWNNKKIEEVVLPESLEFLGGDTFYNCENLKKITIPKKVKSIGDNPFANCPKLILQNQSLNFILEEGALYDKDKTRLIYYSINNVHSEYITPQSLISIGKHSFYNCINLQKITITKNVRIIENNPFSNLPYLRLINKSPHFIFKDGALYNNSMTTLFYYEHSYNSNILKIPEGVRIIGRHSFYNCKSIKKIIIPESVEIIGYNPFARCNNLFIENYSPNYIYENECLYDKNKKELIFHNASSKMTNIVVPEGVQKVGRSAFFECKYLEKVILPKTIKIIERSAFAKCANLKEINLPKSIEHIADWAFLDCVNLEEITILNETRYSKSAFLNCKIKIIKK